MLTLTRAQPSPFTFDAAHTALIVIDMQRDFIERGGFGEALGNDVSRLAAIVPTVRELLAWARALVRLRREHLVLRQDTFFEGRATYEAGRKDLAWFAPDGAEMSAEAWFDHDQNALGMYLHGLDGDCSMLVLINTGPAEQLFTTPGAPWAAAYTCVLDTTDERPQTSGNDVTAGAALALAPHSLQVLLAG